MSLPSSDVGGRADSTATVHRQSGKRRIRRYLDLIAYRTFADLRSEAARTYMGFAWWILEPLLFLVILYFVFAKLRGESQEGFVPFLVVGLVFWQWFRASVSHACDSIRNSMHLLRQVRLPPSLLPLMAISTDGAKFSLVLVVMLVVLAALGHPPTLAYAYLPLVLLAGLSLIIGTGLVVAAVTPVVPDLRLVVETFLTGLMFVSGIFFSVENVPADLQWVMDINPVAVLLSEARAVLIEATAPDMAGLAYVFAFGMVTSVTGGLAIGWLGRRYTKMAH